MIFTKIQLVGFTTIDLPKVGVQPTDRYILKDASGLGPVQNTPIFAGRKYKGRDLADRQIVIRIGLNPVVSEGETPADLRTEIYGLLSPSGIEEQMKVVLCDAEGPFVFTDGAVSAIEIVPFAQDPEVQVTIECGESPYLRYAGGGIYEDRVQYKEPENGIVSDTLPVIDNPGQVAVGFEAGVKFTGSVGSFVFRYGADGTPEFHVVYPFIENDVLIFSTNPKDKLVEVHRSGVTTSLIDNLTPWSEWIKLGRGVRTYETPFATYNWEYLTLKPLWWGV